MPQLGYIPVDPCRKDLVLILLPAHLRKTVPFPPAKELHSPHSFFQDSCPSFFSFSCSSRSSLLPCFSCRSVPVPFVPAFVLSRSLSHFPSLLLITHSPFLSHSHWLVIQIFPSIPGSRDDPFISLHPRPPSPTLSVLTNPSADVIDLHRCVQLWIFEVYAHGETEGTSIQLLTPP